MTLPTKEAARRMGELIRANDLAALSSGNTAAIEAARALHGYAWKLAHRFASVIDCNLSDPGDVALLSGGTPKGDPPNPPG